MSYLTFEQVGDWARHQTDDGESYYCENCMTKLQKTTDGKWYCPNEMCLNDEQYEITEDGD